MLKSLLLFSAALLFALAPTPSLGGPAQETAPAASAANPLKSTPDVLAKGKKLYTLDCAMCHGDNGNGQTEVAKSMELTMDDWTDPKVLAGKQDGELFAFIRNGKDKMPPEASARAKDDEIWAVILYIRTFAKGQMPAAEHPQP